MKVEVTFEITDEDGEDISQALQGLGGLFNSLGNKDKESEDSPTLIGFQPPSGVELEDPPETDNSEVVVEEDMGPQRAVPASVAKIEAGTAQLSQELDPQPGEFWESTTGLAVQVVTSEKGADSGDAANGRTWGFHVWNGLKRKLKADTFEEAQREIEEGRV